MIYRIYLPNIDLIMKIKAIEDTEHKTCYPIIKETYKCSAIKWVEWIMEIKFITVY